MIEIRTFDGEPGELSEFTVGVWRRTYEGRMLLILWNEEFFRRELFPEDDRCRDYLIVAYDGTKLVGSHPSKPLTVRLHGQEIPATWGSFISVDPDYRRRGVALKLQHEWARRHQQRGAMVNLGYQYVRSPLAMGPKFWLQQPSRIPIIRKLGMWVRPFDHATVAHFELHRLESWGTRILSLIQKGPRPPRNQDGLRPYCPEDLDACLKLIGQAGESADLAYLWEPSMLQRQLRFDGLSDTVVLEHDGAVAGLVNYSLHDVLGRCRMTVALIELVAFGSLSATQRCRLLTAAMCRMEAEGAKAAMMLHGSSYGWRTMLAAGFLPTPTEYYYIGARFQDHLRLDGVRQLQVLLR
jgi:GNAT superfamily N-acetyltransferase